MLLLLADMHFHEFGVVSALKVLDCALFINSVPIFFKVFNAIESNFRMKKTELCVVF